MDINKEMSYSDRLVNALGAASCPIVYIDVVRKFIEEERVKKTQFAADNHGVLTFGKYKDKDVREVYKLDPSYCQWLHNKSQKFLRQDVKDLLTQLMK
jgi:hypothetical protein